MFRTMTLVLAVVLLHLVSLANTERMGSAVHERDLRGMKKQDVSPAAVAPYSDKFKRQVRGAEAFEFCYPARKQLNAVTPSGTSEQPKTVFVTRLVHTVSLYPVIFLQLEMLFGNQINVIVGNHAFL